MKWTIGNLANKVNQRDFIPRLPGLIKFIAVSNSHIAVTLSNNCKCRVQFFSVEQEILYFFNLIFK